RGDEGCFGPLRTRCSNWSCSAGESSGQAIGSTGGCRGAVAQPSRNIRKTTTRRMARLLYAARVKGTARSCCNPLPNSGTEPELVRGRTPAGFGLRPRIGNWCLTPIKQRFGELQDVVGPVLH